LFLFGVKGLHQGTENENDAKKGSDDNSFATGTFVLGMLIGYVRFFHSIS